MMAVFASVLAGLGLFFLGLQMLTDNVKRLAGSRFRRMMTDWTRRPLSGLLWGGAFRFVCQSSTIGTFILTSLIHSGAISVRQALPVVIGQNMTGAALVYVASFDIRLFALFLVGFAGLLVTSERALRVRTVAGALLGTGLLFLGLSLIQAGAGPLSKEPWFGEMLRQTAHSYALVYLVGGGLSFLSQSTIAISILAITMTKVGLFSFDQTIMAIYGAHMGSSLSTYLLALKLQGNPRQIAMYQTAFNVVAALVLVPLFYLEIYGGVPLVRALVTALPGRQEVQLAHILVVYGLTAGLILLTVLGPSGRLLERLWPPSPSDEVAKLRYIHGQALGDPETALDLALMELRRLIGVLPKYMGILREDAGKGGALAALSALHESFAMVDRAVAECLDGIGKRNPTPAVYERLNRTISDHTLVRLIEGSVFELAQTVDEGRKKAFLVQFQVSVVEAVDLVLLTAEEVAHSRDGFSRTLLVGMTGDQGEAMRKLREAYLSDSPTLGAEEKLLLLRITNLCERLFWLLHGLSTRGPAVFPGEKGDGK